MTDRSAKAQYDYLKLEGKTAIVTGSTSGIGEATAIMFADLGANVTVCGRNEENVKKVTDNIISRGGKAIGVKCDVSKLEDIRNTIAKTVEAFGDIDILVNNAAAFGGGRRFDKMTYEEWDRVLKVNLTGSFMFTNEVLPYMTKKLSGKIVMVSSGAAFGYDFSDPHYAASKAGMIGLAKELSQELLKYRININAVGVGLTDTAAAHFADRSWEDETSLLGWWRVGLPEDQAATIVFLSSAAADYITGQVLCPNGGAWM
ncbi:MAG: SDR family oxidoreductase [Bacillota bacterium]|nr:SDR family oxidoreductase [Bacillota bacterium]